MKKIRAMQSIPDNATYDAMPSPAGDLTIITTNKGLHAILWDTDQEDLERLQRLQHDPNEKTITLTRQQLNEYFAGERRTFTIPLVMHGTDFQKIVWHQLTKIPYATTISYGELATRVGDKKKARAVGMANGRNPISIIVPCHRVIGSNGKLVGFGGGLDKKELLLQLEHSAHII